MPKLSIVSVIKVKDNVIDAVKKAMELAQWRDFIPAGANISLKPNLGFDLFLPGAVTSPWVVEGVIQTIKDYVDKIYVVEAGQILVDVEKSVRQTGIYDLCKKYHIEWVNMSKAKFKEIPLPDGLVLKEVLVPEILIETTLITIPVMKTHNKTIITGAIKNQWGCLPEFRHNYHLVVDEVLVDINMAIRPKFVVMDATVCLEGNGPKSGRPKILDLVLASGDMVAIDTIQAQIMGFNPSEIKSITNSGRGGLGECDLDKIQVVGENIGGLKYHFIPAKHNLVSFTELFLRQSRWLNKVVFDTFVLKLCCWGALLWYYMWYYVGEGWKLRDEILNNSKYGKQWVKTK